MSGRRGRPKSLGVAYGRVCAVLTLACVASLATSASGGGFGVGVTVGGHERTSSSSSSAPRDGSRSPLLVSLLDGTVQAVDRATGEAMWSFSSGSPLVRAHAAATVDDEDPSASSSSSRRRATRARATLHGVPRRGRLPLHPLRRRSRRRRRRRHPPPSHRAPARGRLPVHDARRRGGCGRAEIRRLRPQRVHGRAPPHLRRRRNGGARRERR